MVSTQQLARARRAARKRGLRGDLSIFEWLQTVSDFEQKCAYCGSRSYNTIDHFIPLARGGGTERPLTTASLLACIVTNAKEQAIPNTFGSFPPMTWRGFGPT